MGWAMMTTDIFKSINREFYFRETSIAAALLCIDNIVWVLRSCVKEIFINSCSNDVRLNSFEMDSKILFISFDPSEFWFLVIVFFCSFLLPMLNFVLGYNLMTSSAGLSHTQSTAQHPLHHSASANKAMMSAIFLSVFFTLTITKTMQRSFKMIVQVFYCLKFWVWIIVADFAVCFTNSCIVCGIVRYGVCKTDRAIS